jgi:hypothetical protein
MDMMVWNIVLSVALGLVSWFARTTWTELQRISILLNRTREEVAKEYVTKQEVHNDINRIVDRLESLDAKLDRIIENRK